MTFFGSIGGIVNQSGSNVAANTGGISWSSSAGTNAGAGSYVLGGKGATAAGYQDHKHPHVAMSHPPAARQEAAANTVSFD